MTPPQIFSAIVGSALCVGSLTNFFRHRTRRFKALFWLAVGSTMVYAGFRPHIIEYFGADTQDLRLRLVVALLSFSVLTVTLEAIRIARMQERYAFLWLATGGTLLAGSLFSDVIHLVTRITGMSYTVSVMVVLFAFVLLMLFSLSVALSQLQKKLEQTIRQAALAEERLRRLEMLPSQVKQDRKPD